MSSTRLTPSRRAVAILALLVPYIVGFTPSPEDSSWTTISIGAGTGSYAHVGRDCSGNVVSVEDMPYNDAAVGIERVTPGPLYGVKAGFFHVNAETHSGYLRHPAQSSRYVNPYIGKEWHGAALRFGVAVFDNDASGNGERTPLKWDESAIPTVELRIGGRPGFYFTTSFGSNMPLGTGGGVFDLGIGTMFGGGGSCWFGMAALPYEEGALALKADIPVLTNLSLNPRFQVRSGDASEYGLSLGLSARF
jgi:hypothetical protein